MDAIGDDGGLVALMRVFPNEQITSAKFGTADKQEAFALPSGTIAISVNLTDTGRVAGFVTPGSEVALFMTGTTGPAGEEGTRLLLPKVDVIAVGETTLTTSTTRNEEGAQTTESLPKTLITLALQQEDAEKVLYAASHGEVSFGLLDEKSRIRPGDGVTIQNLFR
jgi:pilus assembly protein CpaB